MSRSSNLAFRSTEYSWKLAPLSEPYVCHPNIHSMHLVGISVDTLLTSTRSFGLGHIILRASAVTGEVRAMCKPQIGDHPLLMKFLHDVCTRVSEFSESHPSTVSQTDSSRLSYLCYDDEAPALFINRRRDNRAFADILHLTFIAQSGNPRRQSKRFHY